MAFNQGASTGNLVLIQEQTASNSANLEFKTGITGYDQYVLMFYGVLGSAANDQLIINFSTDGGVSYDTGANYAYTGYVNGTSLALTQQVNGGATFGELLSLIGIGTAATQSSGQANFYNLGSSVFHKQFFCNSVGFSDAYGYINANLATNYVNTAIVNAFRISLNSGGNIVTGTFKLYGVAN